MKKIFFTLLIFIPFWGLAQTQFKLKIDTPNKAAFYQEVVKIDTSLNDDQIKSRIRKFLANNTMASNIAIENNSCVYTSIQNLIIPQGLGSMQFQVRYTVTIDFKKGKYRYTFSNIEILYNTLIMSHLERKTLYEEYKATNEGKNYDNHVKRIIALEKHIDDVTTNLKLIMSENSSITKSDF